MAAARRKPGVATEPSSTKLPTHTGPFVWKQLGETCYHLLPYVRLKDDWHQATASVHFDDQVRGKPGVWRATYCASLPVRYLKVREATAEAAMRAVEALLRGRD